MFHRANTALIAVLLVIALAACAPDVDRTASGFDRQVFYTDLNDCRGGSAVEVVLETTGVGLLGSVVGAYHGLLFGLAAGERAEGMLVGAIVGAGAGIGIGAYESVNEFHGEVTECLRVKGYAVS
jgi:uncharacterized membrane protein